MINTVFIRAGFTVTRYWLKNATTQTCKVKVPVARRTHNHLLNVSKRKPSCWPTWRAVYRPLALES